MAKTTINTITINGKVYEDEKGLVTSLIKAGLLTEVKPSKSESKKDEKAEKAEKKDEDWFNEAEYKRLSEKFDVRTQDGSKVLKWARPVIYKVMRGELAENKCKAEITKARKANEKKYGKKTAQSKEVKEWHEVHSQKGQVSNVEITITWDDLEWIEDEVEIEEQ